MRATSSAHNSRECYCCTDFGVWDIMLLCEGLVQCSMVCTVDAALTGKLDFGPLQSCVNVCFSMQSVQGYLAGHVDLAAMIAVLEVLCTI